MNNDAYIIGSLALWAGDYPEAKQRFAHRVDESVLMQRDKLRSASDFIALAQVARRGQMIQQEKEFRESVSALPMEYQGLSAGGLNLRPTNHLAGILFRTGVREFEMRAYLTELSWASHLLKNAELLASKSPIQPNREHFVENREGRPTGYTWEYPDTLFLQVHVNRLGLISALGFWTDARLPESYVLEKGFRNVLLALDPDPQNQMATREEDEPA